MAAFDVGTHCHLSTCNQLDFLPFVCDGCSLIFCLQHREKSTHKCCSLDDTKTRDVKPESASIVSYACSVEGCKVTELVSITCSLCELQLCLQHRIPEDHKCTKLKAKKVGKDASRSQQPISLQQPKKRKNAKSDKMAAKVALMKLKLHSEGHKGIPDSEKLFFAVHALNVQSPPVPLFISNKWTVGKAIDYMAAKLKLQNDNNKASNLKLKFCTESNGNVVPSEMVLETALKNEILFNGSSVIIALLPEKSLKCDLNI